MAITDLPEFVRADGPDKVTGSGRYTADMTLTGMLVGKFRYAEVSHARITRLDVAAARAIPGVFAVITADDVPDVRYSYGIADRSLFARDVVRFEGEIVAAVAATSEAVAEQALAAIEFEYEELPAVTDLEAAIADGSPLVHEDLDSYEITGDTPHYGNVATHSSLEMGNPEAAMAEADIVVTSRYIADASHAVPIEPRAVIAQWEGERVTVWTSTQVPYDARDGVCEALQLPASRVRIIVPHLGGGFGGKCGVHYEPHIAALARAASRPVKLVFSRLEEFIAPDRRREGMIVEVTTGLSSNGAIMARTGNLLLDNGAYMADSSFFAQAAAMHVAGPYKVPNLRIDSRLVYTNHQPSGSVRAPTAPQACWAIESHTDELAAAAGMDPLDFRRLNVVHTGAVGPVGQTYEEIGLDQCLERAAESSGWGRDDLAEDEALGIGIGWWPSFASPAGAYMKMHGDGTVQIVSGANECGTGSAMTLRMIAADELGVEEGDIELVYQDTAVAPVGPGATGSMTLFNHGRAVEGAAQQIAEQLRELAASKLEASADDIVLTDGHASVAGTPTTRIPIVELAGEAEGELLGSANAEMREWPELVGSSCLGEQGFASFLAPQFSCHISRVRVDRDTGVVRVLEVHTAHDSGTILNPVAAHGQVEGGVLMGVGQALTEGTQYDETGRQQNAGLLEYKLQTIADAPSVHTQFVEIFTPNAGPRGSKGLAEAPNVATAASISNAIKAVTGSHVRQLPMTAERVWTAMQEGDSE